MNKIPRNVISRVQSNRTIQRIVHLPGGSNSPSEQAIRSISGEFRSTPRW